MSFQWIIENATELSINRKQVVASTTARDGTTRVVSRGNAKKVFTVTLPDGPRWSVLKSNIESAESSDKYTQETITIPYASFPYYYGNVNPGTDESYDVYCIEFPEWTIFGYDQVRWSGPFVFVEA
jgi:hypothetical protein